MLNYLPYGLRDGRLLTIHEVERGLACGCVCPGCRQPLVARRGEGRTHHFAHYRGGDCGGGIESGLHYRAKEWLERRRRLTLPALYLPNDPRPLFRERSVRLEQVQLEVPLPGLRPDLLVRVEKKWLLLEISVTHPVSPEKLRRIRAMGVGAVELELSALAREWKRRSLPVDEPACERQLLYASSYKRWLFNPKQQALQAQLRRECRRRRVRSRRGASARRYTVQPCPRSLRHYHTAGGYSPPYADVFQDCLHCPFCLEIRYREEERGYRPVPTVPETVLCWGDRPDWLEEFRR